MFNIMTAYMVTDSEELVKRGEKNRRPNNQIMFVVRFYDHLLHNLLGTCMVFETTILPVCAGNKQITVCVELTLETSHKFNIYKPQGGI